MTELSLSKAWYHERVNPVQIRLFDELNENTTSTSIGAYRNRSINAEYARPSIPGFLVKSPSLL